MVKKMLKFQLAILCMLVPVSFSQELSWPAHVTTAWFNYMTNECEKLRNVGPAAVMPNANQKAARALQDEFCLRYMKMCAVAKAYEVRLPYVQLTARESLQLTSFRTGAMSHRDLAGYRMKIDSILKIMESAVYSVREASENAAHERWARAHPSEARDRMMESRLNNVALQNQHALWESEAKLAELEAHAQRIKVDVDAAQIRARNAEARAAAAEHELRRNGLYRPY